MEEIWWEHFITSIYNIHKIINTRKTVLWHTHEFLHTKFFSTKRKTIFTVFIVSAIFARVRGQKTKE